MTKMNYREQNTAFRNMTATARGYRPRARARSRRMLLEVTRNANGRGYHINGARSVYRANQHSAPELITTDARVIRAELTEAVQNGTLTVS